MQIMNNKLAVLTLDPVNVETSVVRVEFENDKCNQPLALAFVYSESTCSSTSRDNIIELDNNTKGLRLSVLSLISIVR